MLITRVTTLAAFALLAAALLVGTGLAVRGALNSGRAQEGARSGDTAPGKEAAAQEKQALAEFQKLYALPKDADLKRVGRPFPDSRQTFWDQTFPGQRATPSALYLRFQDGKVKWHAGLIGGEGITLRDLPRQLVDFFPQKVEGPPDLLDTLIDGDIVVRAGVPAKRIIPALEKILRQECNVPVRLSLREVERKVIVVTGKYKANPLKGRASNRIEIYGETLIEDGTGGGGGGNFRELLDWVGMFIGRQLVSEVEEAPSVQLSWHYNERSKFTAEQRAADRDERLVLKHLAEQTGLTFTEATRRVPVLFVERAG
jgi:hypothetical protein